jgi:hypothetical protein
MAKFALFSSTLLVMLQFVMELATMVVTNLASVNIVNKVGSQFVLQNALLCE